MHRIKQLQRNNALVRFLAGLFIFLLGFIASPALSLLLQDTITAENIILTLFILFGFFTFVTIFLSREAQQNTQLIADELQNLSFIFGQKARFVPYAEAYSKLTEWSENATEEVLILTYNNAERWSANPKSERMASSERKKWFNKAYEIIKDKDIVFQRIVQIDLAYDANSKDCTIEEITEGLSNFRQDELNRKMALKLYEAEKINPDKIFMVSRVYFQNTFVLIDQRYLFMNLDFRSVQTTQLESPYVLLVEDEAVQIFKELRNRFGAIRNRSQPILDKAMLEDIQQTKQATVQHPEQQ